MRRIDTKYKAVDLWGAGKHGFTAGDGPSSIAPTNLSPDFFNDAQENICHPIEYSGQTVGSDTTQLTKAIQRLYRNWTPDLLGSFGTPLTFRTHRHGDVRDTWVNMRGTIAGRGLTSASTHFFLLPAFPADGWICGTISVTYGRLAVVNEPGSYLARGGWWKDSGISQIGTFTVLEDEQPTGTLGWSFDTTVAHEPAVTFTVSTGTWNVLLHYDVNFTASA